MAATINNNLHHDNQRPLHTHTGTHIDLIFHDMTEEENLETTSTQLSGGSRGATQPWSPFSLAIDFGPLQRRNKLEILKNIKSAPLAECLDPPLTRLLSMVDPGQLLDP